MRALSWKIVGLLRLYNHQEYIFVMILQKMLESGEVEMLDSSLMHIKQDGPEEIEYTANTLESSRRISSSSVVLELGKKLLHAAREGDTEGVLDLMSKGAPFTTDWLGTSPLHLAAMNAHEETCRVLLRAGISRDTRTKVDRTPLHLATYEGHARIVRLLIEHGARHDARDMLHMTPLHWAVERRHAECARVLLSAGADVNALSRFRKTPLSLAVASGDQRLIDLLTTAPSPPPSPREPTPPPEPSPPAASPPPPSPPAPSPPPVLTTSQPQTQQDTHSAAALLRRHGITLLPTDTNNTLISALRSGRTVVLSDAGKLMLKESAGTATPVTPVVSASPHSQDATSRFTIVSHPAKPKVARILSINGNQIIRRVTPLPAGATVLPLRNKIATSAVATPIPANAFVPKVAVTAGLSTVAATQLTAVTPSAATEVSRLRAELATVRTELATARATLHKREREVHELKRRLLVYEPDPHD